MKENSLFALRKRLELEPHAEKKCNLMKSWKLTLKEHNPISFHRNLDIWIEYNFNMVKIFFPWEE